MQERGQGSEQFEPKVDKTPIRHDDACLRLVFHPAKMKLVVIVADAGFNRPNAFANHRFDQLDETEHA
jgi:hypothetical protein